MRKTRKIVSFIISVVFVIAVFATSAFADYHPYYDGYFHRENFDVFNSITGWYDFDGDFFIAQTLATCSSGHEAKVETWIIWEDPVSLESHFEYEHWHGYMGIYAQSTVYAQVDNIPTNYESAHFYIYDDELCIEAYLPGPTILIVH